jgi:hypothetical protein
VFSLTSAEAIQLLHCLTRAVTVTMSVLKRKDTWKRLETVYENPCHDRKFLNHEHPSSLGSTTSIIECFGLLSIYVGPRCSLFNYISSWYLSHFFTSFSHLVLGLPNGCIAMRFHSYFFLPFFHLAFYVHAQANLIFVISCNLL